MLSASEDGRGYNMRREDRRGMGVRRTGLGEASLLKKGLQILGL